jgi:hypothetical protein
VLVAACLSHARVRRASARSGVANWR